MSKRAGNIGAYDPFPISVSINCHGITITLYFHLQYKECEAEEDLHVEARRGMFRGFHVLKKIADYLHVSVDSYGKKLCMKKCDNILQ